MPNSLLSMYYCYKKNDYPFPFSNKMRVFHGSFLLRIVQNLLFTQLQELSIQENICKIIFYESNKNGILAEYFGGVSGNLKQYDSCFHDKCVGDILKR